MSERKLARVVLLDDVITHPNADALELAIVGGWQCVVKKGEFKKGDAAIYIEVDAAVPLDSGHFAFLEGRNNVTLDGKRYARIKSIKLRKELSQGLVIPCDTLMGSRMLDEDVTDKLGIVKYEKPEERERNAMGGPKSGASALGFPKFIPKTDQNRVQNIAHMYNKAHEEGELFEKTYKLDGSSLTVWIHDGKVGVASRNVGFRMEDEKKGFFRTLKDYVAHVKQRGIRNAKWEPVIKKDDNAFTQMAEESGAVSALREFHERTGRSIAFQGEMVGPSIQKNFEGVDKNTYYIYDVFDIDAQCYELPAVRQALVAEYGLLHVPVAWNEQPLLATLAEAIADADGPSGLQGRYREGFVYKSTTRDFSFKVISNSYLLKEE